MAGAMQGADACGVVFLAGCSVLLSAPGYLYTKPALNSILCIPNIFPGFQALSPLIVYFSATLLVK